MKIYLHCDVLYRPDKWYERFEFIFKELNINYKLVDLIHNSNDLVFSDYRDGDCLVGRFGHLRKDKAVIKPMYDSLSKKFKNRIFPKHNTYYYYDEKDKQINLFKNNNYPTPKKIYLENNITDNELKIMGYKYPLVMKKTYGAGSENISLIDSNDEISYPCILEEFCPNNDGDIRINVIGDRVMGFKRYNRPNDFRASGSGIIEYIEELPWECCEIANQISKENNFESMAYDFVKDSKGKWVLLEISYTYVDFTVRDCKYFYNMKTKLKEPKNNIYPQDFIIEDFLSSLKPI